LGSIGGYLVIKLVKPTKIVSRLAHEGSLQFLLSEAETDVRASGAGILRKADTTVWQEVSRLDLLDRVLYKFAELLAALVGDRGMEVLDFDEPLADENHLRSLGNAGDPRVTDQLRIESEQASRLLRVAAGGGLPL